MEWGMLEFMVIFGSVTISATVWITVRTEGNRTKLESVEKRLDGHLSECTEASRHLFSILNEVRGDLRELKGKLHAKENASINLK